MLAEHRFIRVIDGLQRGLSPTLEVDGLSLTFLRGNHPSTLLIKTPIYFRG